MDLRGAQMYLWEAELTAAEEKTRGPHPSNNPPPSLRLSETILGSG